MRAARRVRGTTLEPRERSYPSDSTDYTTVIEYRVDGVRHVIDGASSDCRWCHRKGRGVWVYYLPDDPQIGRTVAWWEPVVWSIPILLAIYVAYCIYGQKA